MARKPEKERDRHDCEVNWVSSSHEASTNSLCLKTPRSREISLGKIYSNFTFIYINFIGCEILKVQYVEQYHTGGYSRETTPQDPKTNHCMQTKVLDTEIVFDNGVMKELGLMNLVGRFQCR